MRNSVKSLAFCLLAVVYPAVVACAADRPNILWLTSEDHGPQMGCYGDRLASTPKIDALAARGMVFKHAWSCAPVCAPARTTIISGMYPTSLGAEHMRSEVLMPKGTRMFPQLLREAGYYCSNCSKEDYNLTKPGMVWDESSAKAHWRKRRTGQPFFAVFNATASHESQIRKRPHEPILDPKKVRVPAYHPDTPETRQDWAQYYDQIQVVDAEAGERLQELEDAGLTDETIIFYFADHGSGMPRSKRWPCNSGLQVPMVVYFPQKWRHLAPREYASGAQSERLVSFVDLAPTVLSLAGIEPPSALQGQAFAGTFQQPPRHFLFGFRGRMDERIDLVRSVTDGRYVYLRNYMTHRSQAQHVGYQFETPTTQVWRRLFDEGKLNDFQSIFWRVPKAPEELYDLQTDPDEVRNLADDQRHQDILQRLRQAHRDHARRIRDTGYLTEAEVHARSGKRPPRDALGMDDAYPFDRIFTAAELASSRNPHVIPRLREFLQEDDSGVRYWGAMGALMRGGEAAAELRPQLAKALADVSPSVRVAAAEALAAHGKNDDLAQALDTLKQCADPTKTSAYTSIAALNAIDELGSKAAPILGAVLAQPVTASDTVARANGYVERLHQTLREKVVAPRTSEPRVP